MTTKTSTASTEYTTYIDFLTINGSFQDQQIFMKEKPINVTSFYFFPYPAFPLHFDSPEFFANIPFLFYYINMQIRQGNKLTQDSFV